MDVWIGVRTNLDITATIEQNVVTLDVSMNDVLVVEVLKTLACLSGVSSGHCKLGASLPQSRWWRSGLL
jgi:hypothetical protein